jgi:glycosyltransferase 2 family protein
MLLRALNVKLSIPVDLRFYSLSALPRNIPGFVWFIASRSLLYQDWGVSASLIAAASLLETALLALTGYLLSALYLFSQSTENLVGALRVAPLIASGLLLVIVFWLPNLLGLLRRFATRFKLWDELAFLDRWTLVLALFWMMAAWCGGGFLLWISARSVIELSWVDIPLMIGIWGAAGATSLTVGIGVQGMGIREITLAALLSVLMPPLAAIVLAIAFRGLLTVGELVWSLVFIWLTRSPSVLAREKSDIG